MYDPGPSDEELAMIGIQREDVEDTSDVEIWPENYQTYEIFRSVSSQWRVGPAGPTALDHNTVFKHMELMQLKPKKQLGIIQNIRIMEQAALDQMHKK